MNVFAVKNSLRKYRLLNWQNFIKNDQVKTQSYRHMEHNKQETINREQITRKEAIGKIGTYGKYAALTALGTYLMLSPKKAQATSADEPGTGF